VAVVVAVVVVVSVCMCMCVTESKGPDTNTLGIKLLSNLERDSVKNDEKIAWLHGDVT
jgi:hypothetical protein